MSKIGFIGLGIMGRPMVNNLLKAGHDVVVYDIVPTLVEAALANGARSAKSSREVAELSELTITMLPDGPQVEDAVLGTDGVLDGAQPGSLVIDMSSINPLVSRQLAAACAAKDVDFLDAPVSGGEPKAIDGTLAIMAGGKPEVFERALPVLKLMGTSVTLTGPAGAGNVTKLANQIMVACNIAAMGEALVLATRCGIDPEVVFQAVKGGLAGSVVLNAKAPMVLDRNFKPGFRINLHEKDLRNALLAAEANKLALPLTSLVQQMLMALIAQGKGDCDHSALVTFTEQLAGVEVKRGQEAAAI
jgi:2-hydroxy-3-oxopropionate reductase